MGSLYQIQGQTEQGNGKRKETFHPTIFNSFEKAGERNVVSVSKATLKFDCRFSVEEIMTLVEKLEYVYQNDADQFPIPRETKLKRLIVSVSEEQQKKY